MIQICIYAILYMKSGAFLAAETEFENESEVFTEISMNEYAKTMVTSYMEANDLIGAATELYLSQGIQINNDDDEEGCFL